MPLDEKIFEERLEKCRASYDVLRENFLARIIGQDETIEYIFTALLARSHCLLIGVPGLAKTLMARTIAQLVDVSFKRVQFTPDLLPSDITGTQLLETDRASSKYKERFLPGPIFTNILLADEINRTPPRTQAALLEAMEERQISSGSESHQLSSPFFVIATQNPVEQEGTYPLPEAELDRFMLSIQLGYPNEDDEARIISQASGDPYKPLSPVLTGAEIVEFSELLDSMQSPEPVVEFANKLTRLTRPENNAASMEVREYVEWGAGPRGGLNLLRAAKAIAAMNGRPNPSIEDVKKMALAVLRHRVWTNFRAEAEGYTSDKILESILRTM